MKKRKNTIKKYRKLKRSFTNRKNKRSYRKMKIKSTKRRYSKRQQKGGMVDDNETKTDDTGEKGKMTPLSASAPNPEKLENVPQNSSGAQVVPVADAVPVAVQIPVPSQPPSISNVNQIEVNVGDNDSNTSVKSEGGGKKKKKKKKKKSSKQKGG